MVTSSLSETDKINLDVRAIRLVQGVLADDLAQRRLGDLIDRGVDVVASDDALRLDRHRHNAQRNALQHIMKGMMSRNPGSRSPIARTSDRTTEQRLRLNSSRTG
jgi:hypothetical protein